MLYSQQHSSSCHHFRMTAEITTAAMYLPTELPDTIIEIFLIIGKSGMAPLKSQILPKLEPLRAPLLAKLLAFVTPIHL